MKNSLSHFFTSVLLWGVLSLPQSLQAFRPAYSRYTLKTHPSVKHQLPNVENLSLACTRNFCSPTTWKRQVVSINKRSSVILYSESKLINTPTNVQLKNVNPSDIIDVASFRNNCTSPTMMIQKQIEKKESFDPVRSFFDGILVGLIVGSIAGILTFVNEGSFGSGLQNFGVVTGIVGGMISINNLAGNRVYVYTEAEAINRLTVDFVSMLKAGVDIGFAAYVDKPNKVNNGKYVGTNGVVGCVDCQLRNSMTVDNSSKKYGKLPSHFYLKNMIVDEGMRRQGIARKLIDFVEDYARKETDAKFLALEVDDSNNAAVQLYTDAGFTSETSRLKKEYGTSVFGRTLMTKQL